MIRPYIVWLLCLIPACKGYSDDLSEQKKWLENNFVGKSLMVRNFYTDDKLVFNPKGDVIRGGRSDCWSTAQIRIKKITLKEDRLILDGDRVVGSYNPVKMQMTNMVQMKGMKIELLLDRDHRTDQDIVSLFSKIFLTKGDKLQDLIPPPWQGTSITAEVNPQATSVAKVDRDVSPPRLIFGPDPQYASIAQKAGRQGTILLWMVVGTDGNTHDIKPLNCLGDGLEQKAVEAVSRWKFEPAHKNGQPIAVQLNVEVSFRLY